MIGDVLLCDLLRRFVMIVDGEAKKSVVGDVFYGLPLVCLLLAVCDDLSDVVDGRPRFSFRF